MTRYCANCGTEVDDSALFCPTCGQPISQETEADIPPAPAWPDAADDAPTRIQHQPDVEPDAGRGRSAPAWDAEPTGMQEPVVERREPPSYRRDEAEERFSPGIMPQTDPETRDEEAAVPPPAAARAPGPDRPAPPPAARRRERGEVPGSDRPAGSDRRSGTGMNLPITTPVTLSAWLIGIGAAVGALGALIALFDGFGGAIDLLMLLVLLAVAASVFFSATLPHIPQLRLMTFAVVLVAFGVALDRLGFGAAGAGELLLFLGTAAAAIGAILLETGQDQPLGGPNL